MFRRTLVAAAVCWWPLIGDADDSMPSAEQTSSPAEAVAFEGFGLAAFQGVESIASAIRRIDSERDASSPDMPIDLRVRGPSGRTNGPDPLAAELRSRIEGVDVSAGLQADDSLMREGPARWVGGVGVSNDHDAGREAIELKTSLGRNRQAGVLALEVGPRIERRLRGGRVFFLDGKAQAETVRPREATALGLPSLADPSARDIGRVGVTANTGVVR